MDTVGHVRGWVKEKYTTDNHLLRTEYWLRKLKPDADEAMIIALLAHDIERAFLKNRRPPIAGTKWSDEKYSLWHGKRSARLIGDFLKKIGAKPEFISRVKRLVVWHEIGGDEDRDLVKDVDSVSFFENNIEFFLTKKRELEKFTKKRITKDDLKEKFDYMFNRISSEKARKFALQFYKKAVKALENL